MAGLATDGSRVEGAVMLEVRLEGVTDGVVVSGFVSGTWTGECSRCLEALSEPFELEVHELFEPAPVEGETYLLDGEEIDLEPLVRDAVVLHLPLAPVCADDCRGLCPQCGADRNLTSCDCNTSIRDPRWAALDDLRFEDT